MSQAAQYFAGPAQVTGGYPYSYGAQGSEKFPNPFFDIASTFMPTELNTLFEMSEYIYSTFGTWRMASKRVVAYFLTELMLTGGGDKSRKELEEFLSNDLHLMQELAAIGSDQMVYGNALFSVILPFDRFLRSPAGAEYPIDRIDYKFDANTCTFSGYCPKAEAEVKFEVIDRRSADKKRTRIKRWNPKEIVMRVHPVTGRSEYLWRVNPRFVRLIREGHKFYVQDTDMRLLQTICNHQGADTPLFAFNQDAIMHLKADSTPAGMPIAGWAIPPIIANFKLAYYIQVLRRFDEAIAQDFIVPFRILSPSSGTGGETGDPLRQNNLSVMRSMLQNMVQEHRKDPTLVQISPYPIEYQMVGGEGQQLTPKDQIAMAFDELLNALGYPAELYKGTLSIQAFPVALRLFERTWTGLVDGNNMAVDWIVKRITQHFMLGEFSGRLRSVTLADDIERKALNLQASAGMDVSKATAYTPFGIDYLEEQKRIMEEQAEVMRLQQEAQALQQSNATQSADGSTQGPGGQVGASPGDVYAQAQALAQQLLTQTPETMRRGELIKIKQSNPTLHALVLQQMDQMRNDMRSQGGAMMMEQAKQDAAGGQGMVAQAGAGMVDNSIFTTALIFDQLADYSRRDLCKIASAVTDQTDDPARKALHYVYRQQRGWPVTMR